ncbi:toll-like receptor 18 [Siphateles boraxobius]|uniref:toll-like receptor 18 n=1 Tax=Siphateles boraxobius TaxID=180520 RepID=UPI004063D0C4
MLFSLALLLSFQEVLQIKPSKAKHYCTIASKDSVADCKGLRLDNVPITLPDSLDELDLSFNTIQVIRKEDFSKFSHLRVLKINFNNISLIMDDAFQGNPLLEELSLFNNSMREIPFKALELLTNLKILEMSNNLYTQASLGVAFLNFTQLKVLSIGGSLVSRLGSRDIFVLENISLDKFAIKTGTGFKSYEPGYFSNLNTKNLWLDIAIDKNPDVLPKILKDIANKTFDVLRFRNLFEFQYYTGKQDIFYGLQYVKTRRLTFYRGKFNEEVMRMALVNIQISPIKALELLLIDFARSQNKTQGSSVTNLTLEQLVLSDISNPDIMRFDWSFTWLNHVRQFIVWNVNFNSVPCDSWPEMKNIELLDISNNQLRDSYIYNPLCDTKNFLHKLETFNVSRNRLTSLSDLASLTEDFVKLTTIDMSHNQLQYMGNRICYWKQTITKVIAHHNSLTSDCFKCLPTSAIFLDLSYSSLDQLDMDYFNKASNLTELILSGNKIKFIPSGWRNPYLRTLVLDGNSFGLVSMTSFKDMPSLRVLTAGNNPYHCICDLYTFIQETTSKGKVTITDWPDNYKCYHPERLLNTRVSQYFPGHLTCNITLVIIISVSTTAVVVLAIVLLCYISNGPWYIKATYQIIRAKYRAHKEGSGQTVDYIFHAFISYSHSDAEWVRDQLLPCLENAKPPYRLCIHERDFIPGKWIIDNIIENIESSRKVIFVLSRSFVNSVWCNYELYFAQQRAIGKTFSDVILIVKEPIDPTSLPSKFCKLKKMLSTKTYLEWPQQPTEQSFFWVQLRSVLGKPNVIRQRTASQHSCLSSVRSASLIELPQNQNSADRKGTDEDGHQASDQPFNRCQHTLRELNNNMVSKLENAMEGLITVFHTYSSKEGDKYKLSKAELKSLLHGELGDFLAASKDPMVVEKIMSDLDENRDGEVDFQEFVVLVAALTVACNEFFVESMKN